MDMKLSFASLGLFEPLHLLLVAYLLGAVATGAVEFLAQEVRTWRTRYPRTKAP